MQVTLDRAKVLFPRLFCSCIGHYIEYIIRYQMLKNQKRGSVNINNDHHESKAVSLFP